MIKLGEDLTDEDLPNLTCQRLSIEAKEPTILRVLDLLCHNELCRALGYARNHEIKLSSVQRFFAHFFDIGLGKIEKQDA